MAMPKDSLIGSLSQNSELTITVTGRKSGRKISIPVWFVVEQNTLYLLPVQGSETQWYKNVLKNPGMRVDADGAQAEVHVTPVTDHAQVSSIADKFRAKYGAADVKKYYSKFDVGVVAYLH